MSRNLCRNVEIDTNSNVQNERKEVRILFVSS